MAEADTYLDDLSERATRLGDTRPPLCPAPGGVNEMREGNSILFFLLFPEEAPPGMFNTPSP
jgi:hypothetical protein